MTAIEKRFKTLHFERLLAAMAILSIVAVVVAAWLGTFDGNIP